MASSEVWDRETAERYDSDASDMFSAAVLDPAVDLLAELAGQGPALEFAVGTGRVAVPLADRGIAVSGIDLSGPMIEQLTKKTDQITVAVGDMATTRLAGQFSLVYVVWNSLSNLLTQDEQVECFINAARHLAPGGRFVVELWVPELRRLPEGQTFAVASSNSSHMTFDEFDIPNQRCISHHYRHRHDGTVEYGYGHFRYAWPAELDLMARLAGMRPENRYADWSRTPFDAQSTSHVSIWVKE